MDCWVFGTGLAQIGNSGMGVKKNSILELRSCVTSVIRVKSDTDFTVGRFGGAFGNEGDECRLQGV